MNNILMLARSENNNACVFVEWCQGQSVRMSFVSESPAVSFDPENSGSDQEESSLYMSFL